MFSLGRISNLHKLQSGHITPGNYKRDHVRIPEIPKRNHRNQRNNQKILKTRIADLTIHDDAPGSSLVLMYFGYDYMIKEEKEVRLAGASCARRLTAV